TLERHVYTFTLAESVVFTDEWDGYDHIIRIHATVAHGAKEWARDDDGDGVRDVHVNTVEGMWTTVRNFLRPFRGAHKKYLGAYVAMCEFSINLKRITPEFISALVALH
ncbi:MAG: transposase, partial [Anaerolineae bacterium]|nr:transposase [Anaerolineae bacterium]